VKLYSYIGIGKYTWGCQNISARLRPEGWGGGEGPLNVNLGPLIISETTGARKLKLNTQVASRCGKVLASGTQIFN